VKPNKIIEIIVEKLRKNVKVASEVIVPTPGIMPIRFDMNSIE
jgi:hypothetical protein